VDASRHHEREDGENGSSYQPLRISVPSMHKGPELRLSEGPADVKPEIFKEQESPVTDINPCLFDQCRDRIRPEWALLHGCDQALLDY
jgi:hypothetical protein